MLGRRLLVLAVVLVGLAILAASVAPRESTGPAADSAPAPVVSRGAPEATAAEPTTDDVPGEPPLQTIDARERFAPIPIRVGERIRLAIRNSRVSSVQVGRDGPIESIDPVSPARFDLLYSTPGRQDVRLYGPGLSNPKVIGALDVRPAA